jgi:predicted RNA-binding protein with PUA-like domain
MQYWLIKSEPDCYSIDDLKRDKKTAWTGIRNYQSRNFMRDSMQIGDLVFFYHSGANPPAIVGVAKVASAAHPDLTAQDPKEEHFDPKATKDKPIWHCVDVAFVEKFPRGVTLPEIKQESDLRGMVLTKQGSRLSVQPVSEKEFKKIRALREE